MKIKNFELHDETVMEIGKFAILWNMFEKKYCNNNYSPRALKSIISNIDINKDAMNIFANELDDRRCWFNMLVPEYARLSLHPGNARLSNKEDIDIMVRFINKEEGDNILGCLLIIARIRNNLMHGLKIAEQLDDQIELFKAANLVLESINEK